MTQRENKKKGYLILVLGVLALLYVFSFGLKREEDIVLNSPLQNSYYFFSKNYARKGEIQMDLEYEELPQEIKIAFTPRDVAQHEDKIVPHSFLYPILVYGTQYTLLGYHCFKIITLLSSIFILILVYKTVTHFLPRNGALMSIAIIGTLPIFYIFSSKFLKPELLFILYFQYFFYSLIKYHKKTRLERLNLAMLFAVTAVLFRYDGVIYILPIIVYFLILRFRSIFTVKNIAAALILLAIFSVPILTLNNTLYGSPFKVGYQLSTEIRRLTASQDSTAIGVKGVISLGFDYLVASRQFFYSFIYGHNIVYTTIISIAVLIVAFSKKYIRQIKESSFFKKLFILTLSLFFIVVYLNISRRTYSYNVYRLSPSFIRYLLPMNISLLSLCLVPIISQSSKLVRTLTVALVITVNLFFISRSYGGLIEIPTLESLITQRNFILENTQEDAIIVVYRNDKILVPDRNTLIISYLAEPNQVYNPNARFYSRLPKLDLFIDKLEIILDQEIDLYLNEAENYTYNERLFPELRRRNIEIQEIRQGEYTLYRLYRSN